MNQTETRKQDHLNICLSEQVEYAQTRFDGIHLIHRSLPELSLDEIQIESTFLHKRIQAPIFISSMTGGSQEGAEINKVLSQTAEKLGIPFGLGSIRILFERAELTKDFIVRPHAPSIPIFANLGAHELMHISIHDINAMLARLEVDGIALHLNPAQELYQEEGTRNFKGVISHIADFIANCNIPVIVKETGYGIHPDEVIQLLGYGAKYVDIAGAGGTNWALVEQMRNTNNYTQAIDISDVFKLACSTALILLALQKCHVPTQTEWKGQQKLHVLASGGIRSGLDVVKSLVLGASAVGLALPLLKAYKEEGNSPLAYLQALITQIKKIMLLIGAPNLESLLHAKYWLNHQLSQDVKNYLDIFR